jgi:pseudaminic acid synthase
MVFRNEIQIAGRRIGEEHPPFVVAEISGNHKGCLHRCLGLIHEAKYAGADAVKFQMYTADTMTLDSDHPDFVVSGTGNEWEGRKLYDLYEEAHTPWDWFPKIKAYCDAIGIIWLCSPFDLSAVDELEKLGCPAYKIASLENTDIRLIRHVARTGKPIIISTGSATTREMLEAVWAAEEEGNSQIVILKCLTDYPADPRSMNLGEVSAIKRRHGMVGLSDHSTSVIPGVVAVTLGASIIEKHLTVDREDGAIDSFFSLNPAEFGRSVSAYHSAYESLKTPHDPQRDGNKYADLRRSLYVVEDIRDGELFTEKNVRAIRPGHGLNTRHYDTIIGAKAVRDVAKGTPVSWDLTSITNLTEKEVDVN